MKERSKSGAMLDMVDAASLLTRFDLEGQDPGRERWEALLGLVQPHTEDHVLAFNDAHIAMVLSRLDDEELVQKHSASIAKYSRLWDFDLRSIKCRYFSVKARAIMLGLCAIWESKFVNRLWPSIRRNMNLLLTASIQSEHKFFKLAEAQHRCQIQRIP